MNYTENELITINRKLNEKFKNFLLSNNLVVNALSSFHDDKFNRTTINHKDDTYPASWSVNSLKLNEYFKSHVFFDDKAHLVSRLVASNHLHKTVSLNEFCSFIEEDLNDKEKALFQKFITKNFDANSFEILIKSRSDSQVWFYIQNINDGHKKVEPDNEFKLLFNFIKQQPINSDEKIKAMLNFCEHLSETIKKPEYSPIVCDFIFKNIPKNFHDDFSKILGRDVNRNTKLSDPEDIMNVSSSQVLTLSRDLCFEKIKIKDKPEHDVNNLNSLNRAIIKSLTKNCLDDLGLKEISCIPFPLVGKESKIIFEFKKQHDKILPELFVTLLTECSKIHNSTDFPNELLDFTVKSIVSHHTIKQNLTCKDNILSPRRKI